jgi:NAD(P)-dependent dehydrogenase (short-subunit alcohol dehydrogenase family)
MISNSLTGKLAIITGAASGMGKATAHLFSKHGADLILIDKSENINQIGTEIRMAGAKVHSIVADLTESSRVKAAFDEIKSVRWWPSNKLATILVNSAGNGYTIHSEPFGQVPLVSESILGDGALLDRTGSLADADLH